MFPTNGQLGMSTIAIGLQVPLPPTNSISMSDFGTKGIMRTWNAAGISTPIPVARSGTSLSIEYFRGKYYRNPAILPNTVAYTTSVTLATAPIIDYSSPIGFNYTIVGGGGGGASGGGGYNGSSGNYGGGGGGGGGSGGITSGTGIPYSSGSVNITVGSGGPGGPGVGVNENGNSGGTGGITRLIINSVSINQVSGGNGGSFGYKGDDGNFGERGGRGGSGGTGIDGGIYNGGGGGDGEFDTTLRYAGGGGGGGGGTRRLIYNSTEYGGGGGGSGGGKADAEVFDRYAEGSGTATSGQNGIVIITWYYN